MSLTDYEEEGVRWALLASDVKREDLFLSILLFRAVKGATPLKDIISIVQQTRRDVDGYWAEARYGKQP